NFDLRIFPNPSSSSDFTLSFYGVSQPVSLVVYDVHGSELFAKTITVQDNNSIMAKDINSNLTPGIYYIHASVQGKLINKKLIIQ
ncbi:MAG TPA: T9SS type A sorting domain-containing protein, partial [Cytophagaceae bacterium]|nr:T9SS type A sorting domain-containing protein [Cytophagaceae bacterium]